MPPEDLDFLPDYARAWADEHRGLLELIVERFLASGTWPSISTLTRKLAREGNPTPVRELLWHMPKPFGFVDTPDTAVLLTFGLRMTQAGAVLLDGFIAALRLAVERYGAEDDTEPVLHLVDLDPIVRANFAPRVPNVDVYMRALSAILLREAPFLGSGAGGPGDEWTREVEQSIVHFWDVVAPDDYLRIRASELRKSPQFGWQDKPVELPERAEAIVSPDLDGDISPPPPDPAAKDAFISHAGEDTEAVAEPLGAALTAAGWNIWLDKLELTVGDSLNQRINGGLAQSRFGIVILSKAFFSKHWTQRELDALTAREGASGQKIILPVWHGVDAAYLAEVSPTLADRVGVSTERGLEHVAKELIRALERERTAPHNPNRKEPLVVSVNRVPRTAEEQKELLETRPPAWEYLLFASALARGKEALGIKSRDHELRMGRGPREHFDDVEAASTYLGNALNDMGHATGQINRIFSPEVQVQAFGAPGEPGDPVRIEHMVRTIVQIYETLLDVSAGIRQQAMPPSMEHVSELAAQLIDRPVAQIEEFIDRTVGETDRIPAYLADPDLDKPRLEIEIALTLSVDEEIQTQLHAELDHLKGQLG